MRLIPLAILSALVGVTYWIGATIFTSKIEQDITTRTTSAIATNNPSIDLDVDGRDVTLSGRVVDEKSRDNALSTVNSVWGVRATRDSMDIMDPYNVHAKYTRGSQFIVDGVVDDHQAIDTITSTIAPIEAVSDFTTTARPLTNSGAKLAMAAGAITMLNQGEMWIDEKQMIVTGEAEDENTKALIEQQLASQQDMIDPLDLITEINVPAKPAQMAQTTQMSQPAACLILTGLEHVQEVVLFDVDSDIVKTKYNDALNNLISLVHECSNGNEGNVIVEAHADHDGDESYNFSLSQRRADSVNNYLLQNGLDSRHIASFAFGETRPVSSNATRHEKSFNRRVEVRFLLDSTESNSFNNTIISTQHSE